MPILPLDHEMPMMAITHIMLLPDVSVDGVREADSYIPETARKEFWPDINEGWRIGDPRLERLLATPGATLDDDELAKCWQDGIAMGETYKMLFALMQKRPKLASWRSAMKLVEHIRKGTDLPGSHGYLSNVKTRYVSVAHLWAARLIQNRFEHIDDHWYNESDAFQWFLHDAEILRRVGGNFVAKRNGAEPLLDGDGWRVPDDWQPPQPRMGYPVLTGLIIPELPDDVDTIVKPTGRPQTESGKTTKKSRSKGGPHHLG